MKLSTLVSLAAITVFMVSVASAATESETQGKDASGKVASAELINSHIDTWIQGKVISVNPDQGKFVVEGAELPFATAHAQMRSELDEKLANADPSQTQNVINQVRNEWKDRLDKAQKQQVSQQTLDFPLNAPSQDDLVLLEQQAVEQIVRLTEQGNQPVSGEVATVGVYEVPQNVAYQKGGEALKDLKPGDQVMVGFDSSSHEAYLVIRPLKLDQGAPQTDQAQPR